MSDRIVRLRDLVQAFDDALAKTPGPGGGKSFDYKDYWDGHDLIYTGRGKVGDQARDGQNLDVDENRRTLFVFEGAGPHRLLFLGRASNQETRIGRAPDDNGDMRNVLLFRLRFEGGTGPSSAGTAPTDDTTTTTPPDTDRQPRPFRDEPPALPQASSDPVDPEVVSAKREQANDRHHDMLRALNRALIAMGCGEVQEMFGAIDLWATRPDGVRVIFEARTVSMTNELSQTRGGFAQLHEYRLEYGAPEDELCLVVDRPLAVRRQKLLDSLGVAVLVRTGDDFDAGNDLGSRLIDRLTTPTAASASP